MPLRPSVLVANAFVAAFAQAQGSALQVTSVHQGAQASDAFAAIRYLGGGRLVAGKRSSTAVDRFLRSTDGGTTWQVVGCPGSTGSHTYFFGQNGATLLSGTGDTGQACVMRSKDHGASWHVALSWSQLNALTGSANVRAVFGPVHLGGGRWLANLKTLDSPTKLVRSDDDGATWYVPLAQPGQGPAAWARQMILTSDGVLLWPSCTTDRLYRSTDLGASWGSVVVPGAFLFQPLCDAGNGVYLCGDATTNPNSPIRLHRSVDKGVTWAAATVVNLQRPTTTYWRDVLRVGNTLYASACCVEGSSSERFMELHASRDGGVSWASLGNPYIGPFGGMQAVYQMCATEQNVVFAACQPDSNILRWQAPDW